MTAPRRGRGRPVYRFTPTARAVYLAAVAAGATYTDAAKAAGVTPRAVRNTRAADPQFADAHDQAAATAAATRLAGLPHGESRYNHHRCRCDTCTKAATTARTARPDRQPPAPVHPITHPEPPPHAPDQGSSQAFPLAVAS